MNYFDKCLLRQPTKVDSDINTMASLEIVSRSMSRHIIIKTTNIDLIDEVIQIKTETARYFRVSQTK